MGIVRYFSGGNREFLEVKVGGLEKIGIGVRKVIVWRLLRVLCVRSYLGRKMIFLF